jgi:hypothetical protein
MLAQSKFQVSYIVQSGRAGEFKFMHAETNGFLFLVQNVAWSAQGHGSIQSHAKTTHHVDLGYSCG